LFKSTLTQGATSKPTEQHDCQLFWAQVIHFTLGICCFKGEPFQQQLLNIESLGKLWAAWLSDCKFHNPVANKGFES